MSEKYHFVSVLKFTGGGVKKKEEYGDGLKVGPEVARNFCLVVA